MKVADKKDKTFFFLQIASTACEKYKENIKNEGI